MAACAAAGALFSAWLGFYSFVYCLIPSALFAVTAGVLAWVAKRPGIQVFDTHLAVGSKALPWADIMSIDRTRWVAPLVIQVALISGEHRIIIFPGDRAAGAELMNAVCKMARCAIIDGVPYAKYWGENTGVLKLAEQGFQHEIPLQRPRLLLPEDEREVEQMFQRLKSAGHLESQDESRGARE